ncbi:hypothetical protein Bca52824_011463 [Brassica carinata]|uniref:Uncharacterized protein n=1 Tax=Brassica carinata TaxID=52824 RepID=A0A8X8BB62_BRACI|nr:hypothetical protein Bca52824_011463 [Brassica carinata]
MSSRRKSSSKSHRDCFVPGGSSSHFNDDVPKVEFEIPSVDPKEEKAYWKANGVVKTPRPGIWNPRSFRDNPVEGCPSRSCPNGLAAIRAPIETSNQEEVEESPLSLTVANKEGDSADEKNQSEAESESAKKVKEGDQDDEVVAVGSSSEDTTRKAKAPTSSSKSSPRRVSVYELGFVAIPQGPLTQADLQEALKETSRALQALTDIVRDLIRSVAG